MTTQIKLACRIVGSDAALARALGVTKGAVWQWTHSGRVPVARCPAIEALTKGAVRCESLRPDVDWGVLRGKQRHAKGAALSADARIATTFPAHPKTKKLIRRLGYAGPWFLVRLFIWVAENRSDGDLSGLSDEDIELAVDWDGDEGAFVAALSEVGFLDGEAGNRCIHADALHGLHPNLKQEAQ